MTLPVTGSGAPDVGVADGAEFTAAAAINDIGAAGSATDRNLMSSTSSFSPIRRSAANTPHANGESGEPPPPINRFNVINDDNTPVTAFTGVSITLDTDTSVAVAGTDTGADTTEGADCRAV